VRLVGYLKSNTYCFPTTTMVERTRLYVRLYVNTLPILLYTGTVSLVWLEMSKENPLSSSHS